MTSGIYHNPRIKSLVRYLAATTIRKFPRAYSDIEDVCQDLWLEVFKVIKKGSYKKNKGATFETFLFRHLRFRLMNQVRLAWIRHGLLRDYVYRNKDLNWAHSEVNEAYLCEQIKKKLKPFEQKVFEQHVNPDPELLRIVNDDPDPGLLRTVDDDGFFSIDRKTNDFNQTHLAYFFNVSQMTISRAMKVIRKVTEEVIKGEE